MISDNRSKIGPNENRSVSECVFGTILDTLHAEDTLRAVFPSPGIIGHIHIHGTYAFALSAVDAQILITFHTHQRKIAHGL